MHDPAEPRHDWTLTEVEALFDLPFTELVFAAAQAHRRWFDPTDGSFRKVEGTPFEATGSRRFTAPERNARGEADFVLLVEGTA